MTLVASVTVASKLTTISFTFREKKRNSYLNHTTERKFEYKQLNRYQDKTFDTNVFYVVQILTEA